VARFRNTTSSPLDFFNELGMTVGPFAEFDWPAYDPDVHGAVPGCERIDKPRKRRTAAGQDDGQDDDTGSGTGDDTTTPNSDAGSGDGPAASAASEETPR
jgi:hypothetical protein